MTEQSSTKAALWMAGSIACFLTMSVAGRTATAHLNVFQVMEIRSVVGWLMLLPLVMRAGGFAAMRTRRPLMHISRNVIHYSGQYAWLYALGLIPLAELVSIEFTTPLWTAVFALAFLGEKLDRRKIAAMLLGIIGVAIIVRPGGQTVDPGHLIMLGGAVAFGASLAMVRSLTRTDNVVRIIFWMLVIQSLIGLVPAIRVWQAPTADLWPALLIVAFTGTFSHFCLACALSHAEATVVSPMDFARLPLSALLGWALYAERLDLLTAVGAVLILGGNLFNMRRSRADDPAKTPAFVRGSAD